MAKGTKVRADRHHTFAGKDYAPGDTYIVRGDEFQTEEQYVDTLRGSGLARPSDEDGPNIVEEVGAPEPAAAPAPASRTAVQPLTTDEAPARPATRAARTAKPARATSAKVRGGKK